MSTVVVQEPQVSVLLDKSTGNTIISMNTPTVLESNAEHNILVSTVNETSVLNTDIPGPPGPPGENVGEEELAQEKRVDFISNEELYRAEAVPGSLDASAVWRIRKITIDSVDGDVRETWANGNSNYDKVWNSRFSYTYST